MSLNWVMLPPSSGSPSVTNSSGLGFVPLPNERPLWHSSLRIQFSLATPRTYPAHEPLNITSDSGTLYLTNQRLLYLPKKQTANFQSFSAPLLNLHDSHLVMPWFGPNSWTASVQPVPGGNIPNTHAHIELKLTFKEGGAPDFTTKFEQIKERLSQVVTNARDANGVVDMGNVHLDELPTYDASGRDGQVLQEGGSGGLLGVAFENAGSNQRVPPATHQPVLQPQVQASHPPADAPPGYEQAQQQRP